MYGRYRAFGGVILPIVGLLGVGLLSIYSATQAVAGDVYFVKQLVFTVAGLVIALIVWWSPLRIWRNWAQVLYGVSILLLLAVLVVGRTVYGAKSWLYVGGLSIQPAELAKLSTILLIAAYIHRPEVSLQTLRDTLVIAALAAIPIGLILLQPDLGSASVFGAIVIGMCLWGGMDLLLLFALISLPLAMIVVLLGEIAVIIGATILVLILLVFWIVGKRSPLALMFIVILNVTAAFSSRLVYEEVLKPHQKQRIDAFLNPYADPYGSGYHVIQSMIAVGSGGFWGKGFLEGTQTQLRYIPKQWTDFIFCVPAEEFGFVGAASVLFLYAVMLWNLIQIARRARLPFNALVVIGVATMWFYHVVVNVGMALGWVPVIGIPLPFLSAGGSSLIVNLTAAGIVLNVARQQVESRTIQVETP